MSIRELGSAVRELVASPEWGLIRQCDGFYLFARNVPSAYGQDEITQRISDDAAVARARHAGAQAYRCPFSWYLVGTYSWAWLRAAW
jgi:hypothetical protein